MATLGTEESGHYREVAVVSGLNNSECMDFLPKKMAVVERWPLVEVGLCLF